MAESKPRCTVFKIVTSVLGIVSGISIFATFIPFHNYHAATWGLISAIFAGMNARLHIIYAKKRLRLKYTSKDLWLRKWIGIGSTILTIIAAIVYFTLMGIYDKGYKLDGYAPSGIFASLTLKFTIGLIFAGITYEKYLKQYELLENDSEAKSNSQNEYNSIVKDDII